MLQHKLASHHLSICSQVIYFLALVGVGQYPLADRFRVDGIGKGQGMLRKCLLSAGGMA